jgi:hypothetical protein
VACTGRGDYDQLSGFAAETAEPEHFGDFGSPVVLEIWPGQHFSPIHSHGSTTGIIYCLTGQIDVMLYGSLDWDAEKVALLTVSPGQCAWLTESQFPVHKVFCPMPKGDFAATFHVYLNLAELPLLKAAPEPHTRDQFEFVDEAAPHELKAFPTYSDLSWRILRRELSAIAASHGL